jgi:hypothetical protein
MDNVLARSLGRPQYLDGAFTASGAVGNDPALLCYLAGISLLRCAAVVAGGLGAPTLRVLWWRLRGRIDTLAMLVFCRADGLGRKTAVRLSTEAVVRWMYVVSVTIGAKRADLAHADGQAAFPGVRVHAGEALAATRPDRVAGPLSAMTVGRLLSRELFWVDQAELMRVTSVVGLLRRTAVDARGRDKLIADALVRGLAEDRWTLGRRVTRAALITLHALGGLVIAAGRDGSLWVTGVPDGHGTAIGVQIAADGSFRRLTTTAN